MDTGQEKKMLCLEHGSMNEFVKSIDKIANQLLDRSTCKNGSDFFEEWI